MKTNIEANAESFVKKVKFWVVLVLSIASAGFYVATTYAKASDLKALQERSEFDQRRLDVLQDRLQQIQEDTKYLRQLLDNMLQRQ